MHIEVNGQPREVRATTVDKLLDEIGLAQTGVAVERNAEIVLKAKYGETSLSENDRIEIVHFVGGG